MSTEARRAFAIRTSIGFAGAFLPLAVQLAFLPIWLAQVGFSADQIGALLGAALAARVVLVPVLVAWSDRFETRRRAYLLYAGMAAAAALLLLDRGQVGIAIAVIIASVGGAAVIPVVDAIALGGVRRFGTSYGRVRLWGSVAFVAATFATSGLVETMGYGFVPLAVIGTVFLTVGCGFAVPTVRSVAATTDRPFRPFADPNLLGGIICGSLVVSSQATYYAFSSIHWAQLGFSADNIAALWSIGVVAEIILFAIVGKWFDPSPRTLLLAGVVCGIVRWGSFPFGATFTFYALNSLLHAGTFAAAYLGTQKLIAARVREAAHGKAQGLTQIVAGPVTAGMTVLSGSLFARFGVQAFYAAALLSALAIVPLLVLYPQSSGSGGETTDPE